MDIKLILTYQLSGLYWVGADVQLTHMVVAALATCSK